VAQFTPGNYIYKKTAGYNGVADNAKSIEFDQTFFIASCTKLITSIASMQLVERGLINLNDPIDKILPELASQPILKQRENGTFETFPAKKSITLRSLLTHSSGATYDWIDPRLTAWRISRGETPRIVEDGNIAEGYAYPRAYEAGEDWAYSGGPDWASLLVARLTETGFEAYIEENIAKPLGITSFTWHLPRKLEVAQKLMMMTTRQDDGTFVNNTTPFWPDPVAEGGGAGMYANVLDFTRVLSDLLKTSPTLLRKETVDQLFSPQFAEGSSALAGLKANGEFAYKCALDNSMEGVKPNQGLGGLLLMEDVKRDVYFKPKGTLSWTGLPNLLWSVNRERGLALMVAMQTLPWADRKSFDLVARFETAVWRNLKAE
jgi:CubicO group peptidase (beta-lactamase class C family)